MIYRNVLRIIYSESLFNLIKLNDDNTIKKVDINIIDIGSGKELKYYTSITNGIYKIEKFNTECLYAHSFSENRRLKLEFSKNKLWFKFSREDRCKLEIIDCFHEIFELDSRHSYDF